ncbi:MAG: hypothetical protein ACTIJ9_04190 [Aequorivita sp.]
MKKVIMSLALAAFTIAGMQAQENKTLKKESTVKRMVTKEGSNVKVKEVKSTDTESGAVLVEGNSNTNQKYTEDSKRDLANEVVKDEVDIDENNETLKSEIIEKQKAELEASKKRQLELAAKKKQEYKEKELQMKKELEERKEKLQARPKGMNKLKKD